MKSTNNTGFTFVELIVVVVILGVLSTIGFLSYTSYLTNSRDSNRKTQIANIRSGLNLYGSTEKLPIPEDNIEISAGGTVIGYQGYAGNQVLQSIGYNDGGKDPSDETYFTYYISSNLRNFQLMAFLEDDSSSVAKNILSQSYAAETIDYSIRYPTVAGKPLGIMVYTEDGSNAPIQDVLTSLDIVSTTENFNAYYTDDNILSGTGGALMAMIPNKDCKRIQELGNYNESGSYKINPRGLGEFQVWCDMETDGGGWTVLVNNDNADDEYESNPAINTCYPRLSGDPSHTCGSIGQSTDFVVDANGMNFQELVWGVYGTKFSSIKTYRLLKWDSEQTITSSIPLQLPAADNDSDKLPGYENLNLIYCSAVSTTPASFIETGVPYNAFPHNPVTIIGSTSYDAGKIGFTDANANTSIYSSYGFDDFQDGQSCGDVYSDQSYRGYSSYIMIR